jgi:hypothetical protein
MQAPDHIQVRTLRVLSQTRQADQRGAFERRCAHWLGRADLRPAGLPPSAVLFVRRLRVPAPIPITIEGSMAIMATWARAARSELGRLLARAHRFAEGAPPNAAEAVLFLDRAELLAWLAMDVAAGRAGQRWWWSRLAPPLRVPTRSQLGQVLSSEILFLPAVIAQLCRQGQAAPVLELLDDGDARALTGAVVAAHGHEAVPLVESGTSPAQPPPAGLPEAAGEAPADPAAAGRPVREPFEAAVIRSGRTPAPVAPATPGIDAPDLLWARWWPPEAATLSASRQLLLGVALALHHAPRRLMDPHVRRAIGAWVRAALRPAATMNHVPADLGVRPPPAVAHVQTPRVASAAAAPLEAAPTGDPSPVRVEAGGARASQDAGARPAAALTAAPVEYACSRARADMLDRRGEASVGTTLPEGQVTELGGVLFLLNLMRTLELPAAFEAGWRLDSGVGPWGLLDLLARALLGSDGTRWASDPLWATLTALAGHAPTEARAVVGGPPPDFRLPAAWGAFRPTEAPACWAERDGWLRVFWRDGFAIAECRRDHGAAEAQARHELGAAAVDQPLCPPPAPFADCPLAPMADAPLLAGVDAALLRWLSLAVPYLRLRLGRALGLRSAGAALTETLLLRHGRLHLSSTHVDLVLPLEQVTVPVRCCGLDANPGWRPELGRVVLFHFG